MEVLREKHAQIEHGNFTSLPTFFVLCISFIWLFLSYIFFYQIGNLVSKLFSWVLWAAPANQLNPRRELWEPLIYIQKHRQQVLAIGSWGGGWSACGTETLSYGVLCYLQVDRVRIELNCRTPSWYGRELISVGKTHIHLVIRSVKGEVLCGSSKGETHRKSIVFS